MVRGMGERYVLQRLSSAHFRNCWQSLQAKAAGVEFYIAWQNLLLSALTAIEDTRQVDPTKRAELHQGSSH